MKPATIFIAIVCATLAGVDAAEGAMLGPSPYLSFADSPFSGGTFDYFYLEDFEDGALNTPGVTASGGFVVGPTVNTDSVDADDGIIDGWGKDAWSYYQNRYGTSITFTFNQTALGQLPTYAGVVWTDVGGFAGLSGYVTFTAYDASGATLGKVGPTLLGDSKTNGSTAEDRFFGISGSTGIKRITLAMDGGDWEMDHLQYGLPEPATLPLLAVSALWLAQQRRPRR